MKKMLSLAAGPTAALIALKCPVCILAFAGLGAGVGSLVPIVQGVYWTVVLGLGGLFTWFLIRSWRRKTISVWVVGLGLVGFGALICQIAVEPQGVLSFVPAAALLLASMASFMSTKRAKISCCERKGSLTSSMQ